MPWRLVRTLCGFAALGCAAKPPETTRTALAQTARGRPEQEERVCARLGPLIHPLVERRWMQSVAVAWRDADKQVFCSFGNARGDGAPATPDTIYEIGSLTKLFTGVLLGSMLADDSVRLDEPVAELLPPGTSVGSFQGRKITLLQLATHRSGLPRMPDNVGPWNAENPYVDYDRSRMFAYLAKWRGAASPGAQHVYSNLGAALLGQALALRASQPYEELVRARVLEPLGMRDSCFVIPPSAKARAATGHDADGTPRSMWDLNALSPAGALRSTARDMARFADAALRTAPAALSRALELSKAPRADADGGRRIGLFFQMRPDGVYWHNGSTGGFSSYMAFDPRRAAGVVLLSSAASILTDSLGDKIFEFQSGAPLTPFDLPDDLPLTSSQLAEYEGHYALAAELLVRVFLRGDALYTQAPGAEAQRIWPSKHDHFYLRVVDARLEFERDRNGSVSALSLDHDGARQRGVRLK